jgi:hypothetical protein
MLSLKKGAERGFFLPIGRMGENGIEHFSGGFARLNGYFFVLGCSQFMWYSTVKGLWCLVVQLWRVFGKIVPLMVMLIPVAVAVWAILAKRHARRLGWPAERKKEADQVGRRKMRHRSIRWRLKRIVKNACVNGLTS